MMMSLLSMKNEAVDNTDGIRLLHQFRWWWSLPRLTTTIEITTKTPTRMGPVDTDTAVGNGEIKWI